MKRILTAACGLTAIGVLSAILIGQFEPRSYAQQPTTLLDNPDIIFSENPEQAAADEAVFRAVEDVEPAALIVDQAAPDVREEMLKLLRRRVELMDEKEISALFEQVKSELNEAEAKRALETIRAELEQLAERYPDTRAASRPADCCNPWPPLPTNPSGSRRKPVMRTIRHSSKSTRSSSTSTKIGSIATSTFPSPCRSLRRGETR